jgi:hypothetical protein
MEKIENRRKEIEESKYFNLIEHKIIKHIKKYNADTYIKLLKSFPDHLKYRKEFFEEIEKIITKNKNEIDIRIRVNLEIAEKKET